jgi:hypothetical protein
MLEDEVLIQYFPPENKPLFKLTLPPGLYNSPKTFVYELNRLLFRTEDAGKGATENPYKPEQSRIETIRTVSRS